MARCAASSATVSADRGSPSSLYRTPRPVVSPASEPRPACTSRITAQARATASVAAPRRHPMSMGVDGSSAGGGGGGVSVVESTVAAVGRGGGGGILATAAAAWLPPLPLAPSGEEREAGWARGVAGDRWVGRGGQCLVNGPGGAESRGFNRGQRPIPAAPPWGSRGRVWTKAAIVGRGRGVGGASWRRAGLWSGGPPAQCTQPAGRWLGAKGLIRGHGPMAGGVGSSQSPPIPPHPSNARCGALAASRAGQQRTRSAVGGWRRGGRLCRHPLPPTPAPAPPVPARFLSPPP